MRIVLISSSTYGNFVSSYNECITDYVRSIYVLKVIREVQVPAGTLVSVYTALLAVNTPSVTLVLSKFVSRYGMNILEE
jgi:hypothetical protein